MTMPPIEPGQKRVAILGGRAVMVRLVQPTPDHAAWTCVMESETDESEAKQSETETPGHFVGTMFVIATKDLRELID